MHAVTNHLTRDTFCSPVVLCLVLCLLIGCSKSITSIGPFEGLWSGELGYYITSGFDTGMIQFEVGSDRTVKGYGEISHGVGSSTLVKVMEFEIQGMINPNGSFDCRYTMRWIAPSGDLEDIWPPGNGDYRNGSIGGYLNPALNYGIGSCLTGKKDAAWLSWLVHRQE